MDTQKIGGRILSLRKSLKLSQKKFSELTGVQRTYLSAIEKEHKIPSFNFIMYLIDTIKINANWLLTGQGEMYNDVPNVPNVPMPKLKGKTVKEIDEHLKKLKPEQREHIFRQTFEMIRINEIEDRLQELLKEKEERERGKGIDN